MLTHMHIDSVHDLRITVQQFNDFVTVNIENQDERDSVVFFLRDMDEAHRMITALHNSREHPERR